MGFGIMRGGISATAGATLGSRRNGSVRLRLKGLLQDLLGDHLTDLDGQLLQVLEGGSPGGAVAAEQAVRGVFRCPFQRKTDFSDQFLDIQFGNHRLALSAVTSILDFASLHPFYQSGTTLANR
jgi:hypothetical protein